MSHRGLVGYASIADPCIAAHDSAGANSSIQPEQQMIFRSPHPDISIPKLSLSEFVLGAQRAPAECVALVDAGTGRAITYRGFHAVASLGRDFQETRNERTAELVALPIGTMYTSLHL
jgi:hypothetical protein